MNVDMDFDIEVAEECIRISKLMSGRAFDRAKVYPAALDAIRKKHGIPSVDNSKPVSREIKSYKVA